MNEDLVEWLVSDIKDSLDETNVGLYEFFWALRGRDPSLAEGAMLGIAEKALRQLLTEDAVKLVLMRWPNPESEGDVDPSAIVQSSWNDPPKDGTYLALAWK